MRILDALINKWTCMHEWDTVAEVKSRLFGHTIKYIYCCKKCGKFKKVGT